MEYIVMAREKQQGEKKLNQPECVFENKQQPWQCRKHSVYNAKGNVHQKLLEGADRWK